MKGAAGGAETQMTEKQSSNKAVTEPLTCRTPAAIRRKRNASFSAAENMVLVSKIVPLYEKLLGKQKSETTMPWKTQMWQQICSAVNSVGTSRRSITDCKKRFASIKVRLSKKMWEERRHITRGHTSPLHIQYKPYEVDLKRIVVQECTDALLIEVFDSSYPGGTKMVRLPEYFDDECPGEKDLKLLEKPSCEADLHSSSLPEERRVNVPSETVQDEEEANAAAASSTAPEQLGTLGSTESVDLEQSETECQNTTLAPEVQHSVEQRSSTTPALEVNPVSGQELSELQKSFSDTQTALQKGIVNELNILHLDLCQVTNGVIKGTAVKEEMLNVETQRNNLLSQMNKNISILAESIQQLAAQQINNHKQWCSLLQQQRTTATSAIKDLSSTAPAAANTVTSMPHPWLTPRSQVITRARPSTSYISDTSSQKRH